MTTKYRPAVVADRQADRLRRLGIARRSEPGSPSTITPATAVTLGLVAALDHALELARLARMAARPDKDTACRRRVVIVGAVATAIAADVQTGGSAATERLYLAISAYQRGSR